MILLIAILMSWWTATIAKKKGYNVWIAVFLGLVFGLFAVIVYSLVNEKKKKA